MKKTVIYPKEILAVIPKGMYCHGPKTREVDGYPIFEHKCPFWFKIKGRPKQHDGFCILLGKGDLEINKEAENKKCVVHFCKSGQKAIKVTKTYKQWGRPYSSVSMLWDQCKEEGCPKYE